MLENPLYKVMDLSRVHVIEWFFEMSKLSTDTRDIPVRNFADFITCSENFCRSVQPVCINVESVPRLDQNNFLLRHSEVNLPINTISQSYWQRCKVTGLNEKVHTLYIFVTAVTDVNKMDKTMPRRKGIFYRQWKEGSLTGLVTSCVGITC